MTFYSGMASTAVKMIADYGQDGTLVTTTITGGGPADPVGGTETETETPGRFVVLPIKAALVGQDVAGTNIRQTDVMIYGQPTMAVVPQPDDRIVCGVDTYVVLRCNVLAPGAIVVLLDIVGRKL